MILARKYSAFCRLQNDDVISPVSVELLDLDMVFHFGDNLEKTVSLSPS